MDIPLGKNMPSNKSNDGDLKKLLAEWKLENILAHLRAEEIDVEILEMMNISHIRLLLCNFSLGVQIRFEYNFERWRRSIGKPLNQTVEERSANILRDQEIPISSNTTNDIKIKPLSQSKITQTDLMILETNSHANSEQNNDDITASSSTKPAIITEQTNIKSLDSTTSSTTKLPKTVNPTPIPCVIPPEMLPKVDLRNILSVVPYGVELLNKYRERKSFTSAERRQLVTVIVNYYLDNNIKFNLQTSYALEHAILKMFSSEKLEMYRTAKNGRIYSRYLHGRAAIRYGRRDQNENSDMDLSSTGAENCFSFDNFSDDSQIAQARNTAESMASNMSHMDDDEHYDDVAMMDDEYTVDFIGEGDPLVTNVQESKVEPVVKIESENVPVEPRLPPLLLSAEFLFKKKRSEDYDAPFDNFQVPWHKVPSDVIGMLERQEKLGKRLNTLANLLVDELRSIYSHVPMRVFRSVTQQVVTKYPYSFLDTDADGNIIASATIPLLQRMRNRNNFLNR